MRLFLFLLFAFSGISIQGCGTYTPIPSHGGGKRFAIEQILVSGTARETIAQIPLDDLKNKRVAVEISMIHDEGGGSIGGGRNYLSNTVSVNRSAVDTKVNGDKTSSTGLGLGVSSGRDPETYVKDLSYNSSDGKQFVNLVYTYLLRSNIQVVNLNDEQKPDFMLEIIVDTFGTWRQRTDWLISNSEVLKAITSVEYVITPLKENPIKRKVGRLTYEGEYKEDYNFWIGPTETKITVKKSPWADVLKDFGVGVNSSNNISGKSDEQKDKQTQKVDPPQNFIVYPPPKR